MKNENVAPGLESKIQGIVNDAHIVASLDPLEFDELHSEVVRVNTDMGATPDACTRQLAAITSRAIAKASGLHGEDRLVSSAIQRDL